MPGDDEWAKLISADATVKSSSVKAIEYRRNPLGSFAAPPLLACDDGSEYWVKYLHANGGGGDPPRTAQAGGMVTDRIVALLARKLDVVAVPEVCLADLASLIPHEPRLANALPGLAHGSRNAATNCTGKIADFAHGGFNSLPINRPRVAALAVLYGLAYAADRQVIFSLGAEPFVYSVDHGHFFPGGPQWNAAGLAAAAAAAVDHEVVQMCAITRQELAEPLARLSALTVQDIAFAVAAPPDEWCFSMPDRIAVARFLWARRDAILISVHS